MTVTVATKTKLFKQYSHPTVRFYHVAIRGVQHRKRKRAEAPVPTPVCAIGLVLKETTTYILIRKILECEFT